MQHNTTKQRLKEQGIQHILVQTWNVYVKNPIGAMLFYQQKLPKARLRVQDNFTAFHTTSPSASRAFASSEPIALRTLPGFTQSPNENKQVVITEQCAIAEI